ncbi:Alanine--tRNA ligase [Candidatus Hepatoplasma crinochetorum Av]|uniref:Alanine--tRNA ligase n=1 Tax=Candidatus Hepatoplasma crinochetorum Av TaxID=1427984 RepID=W8GF85_9MOLU|nr:alanine--tRNA ligase [Candidatus Hepatoplasma crinochetorum]AHK22414.1 Alanine--tRNA ligase [Candidatus Hepatoplasma crinochetorum Av]
MKKLNSNQIRKLWIDFFTEKNHLLIPSSSLIPKNDNSLLWINSGIATLKKYFSAEKKPPSKRLVNYQRSIRTGDIDKIGITARHQTFFEMLGNFSIGDYFKKEAIDYAYELLFSEKYFAFSKEKIYITVFEDDNEAYNFWIKKSIAKNHIFKMGRDTNFWDIGKGPCGPSTEIFYDRGINFDKRDAKTLIERDIENDRFIEIWNIVFSEFNNDGNNNYKELPQKNIDTGAGLERLAMIFQKTPTNFESDIFKPIIKELEKLSTYKYLWNYHPTKLLKENKKQWEINSEFKKIADFTRSITFMLADQANFSSTGRGYVIRRLLRESIIIAEQLEINYDFFTNLIPIICQNEKQAYPHLLLNQEKILNLIFDEADKFNKTYTQALKILFEYKELNKLDTDHLFKLHETYGLPLNLSYLKKIAKKYQIEVDYKRLAYLNDQFKLKSKQNTNFTKGMKIQKKLFPNFKNTEFLGYKDYQKIIKAKVIAIKDNYLVCDKTIFYATSGGQESDLGTIDNINVLTVFKTENDLFIHLLEENPFKIGQEVSLKIDLDRREKLTKNHSATHLLFKALEITLNQTLKQEGSKVDSSYLRFDFAYSKNLLWEDLKKAEKIVNDWIRKGFKSEIKILKLEDALKLNPGYLETKNYKDFVRVVKLNEKTIDLCGGTHVDNIKIIEEIKIVKLEKKGSGVYRLIAISGKEEIKKYLISQNIELLNKKGNNLIKKIDQLIYENKKVISSEKLIDLNNIKQEILNLNLSDDNFKFKLNNIIIKSKDIFDFINNLKNEKLKSKLEKILEQNKNLIYYDLENFLQKDLIAISLQVIKNYQNKTLFLALFKDDKYTLFIILGKNNLFINEIDHFIEILKKNGLQGGGKNQLYIFGGRVINLIKIKEIIKKFIEEKENA